MNVQDLLVQQIMVVEIRYNTLSAMQNGSCSDEDARNHGHGCCGFLLESITDGITLTDRGEAEHRIAGLPLRSFPSIAGLVPAPDIEGFPSSIGWRNIRMVGDLLWVQFL